MDEQSYPDSFDLSGLIIARLQGTITPLQQQQLDDWIGADPAHNKIWVELNDAAGQQAGVREMAGYDEEAALGRSIARKQEAATVSTAGSGVVRRIHYRRTWWVAASVVLLISAGVYVWFSAGKSTPPSETTVASVEIESGREGAILTLADGKQVVLDSLGNGVVARQNGSQVLLRNGQLIYDADKNNPGVLVYNTMRTPRGRQFQVTLPDGSHVWLNAASSIKYPVHFLEKERTVEITGEAYLEVAKDAAKPFVVLVNASTRVEVLGTSFNINAYSNERSINTTLLEGKVRVVSPTGPATLQPGQQAQVQAEKIKVVPAETERVLAWKNGLFFFKGVPLEDVMRQLERWYDIQVVYENGVPNVALSGKMTRGVTLTELLKGLQELGLHTQLRGRQLLVLQGKP
jgi:transmembrane sensor